MKNLIAAAAVLILTIGTAKGQTVSLTSDDFASNGDYEMNVEVTGSNGGSLRVVPTGGFGQGKVKFLDPSGGATNVSFSSASPSNKVVNNVSDGSYTITIEDDEIPSNTIYFEICLYEGGGNASQPDCTPGITVYPSMALNPTLSLSSNSISTTVETRQGVEGQTYNGDSVLKTFGQKVTLSWEDLVSGDQISVSLGSTLPNDWKLRYSIDESPYQEIPDTGVSFVPQNFPDGSVDVTYQVVVPLYEAPQTVTLNPTYEVVTP
jgi:hypothetical protein